MKQLAILGSTGSIGCSTLAVVDAHPTRLSVVTLAAGENHERLAEQIARYQPKVAAMATSAGVARVRQLAPQRATEFHSGAEGLIAAATHPDADIVICASAGTAALDAVMAAIKAGKTIAIANKEILVMAGQLVTDAARKSGVLVLPVDSEHNAIHQCLHGRKPGEIRRLILTASGGPFRKSPVGAMNDVTPEAALQHPTWRMGRKITVDSATMMNKGLEVIEARWLFDVPADGIDVLVHPQSIVHSLVELVDGSIIAQMGVTSMQLPIQYACSYPERWSGTLSPLDLAQAGPLEFESPDLNRFPCLALAYEALAAGGTAPAVLNAVNEVAVDAFLSNKLKFTGIPRLIESVLAMHTVEAATSLDTIREADSWARATASQQVSGLELRT